MITTPLHHRSVASTLSSTGALLHRGVRGVTQLALWYIFLLRRAQKRRRIAGPLAVLSTTFLFLGLLVLVPLYVSLPAVTEIGSLFAPQSSVILDRNGTELYRIHGDEDRTDVPLSAIALKLQQATIAIEDERFLTRRGCFDLRAFLRALLGNLTGGWKSQGGSTLTQQFAKQALTGSQKTIFRKIRQVLLGCELERVYDREEILTLYLNRIPYGHGIHGVEQAARTYFASSASGVTLAQAAVLAAMPQRPSYFSPYGAHLHTTVAEETMEAIHEGRIRTWEEIPDAAVQIGLLGQIIGTGALTIEFPGRTDHVLRKMRELGMIDALEEREALTQLHTLTFRRTRENIRAPHFVLSVQQHILDLFPEEIVQEGGLRITTTLDWELQQYAEQAVTSYGTVNRDLYGAENAALISLGPTGDVLAYVGNRDYWDDRNSGKVDMVRAPRQTGSSFKPFVYAAAFLQGYGPATVIEDVRTSFGSDRPENYDGAEWGPITMRRALGASRNIPAVKSFFLAGQEEPILSLTTQMGIPALALRRERLSTALGTPYEYGWPLALGAGEVPLLELTTGYLTLQRGGNVVPPVTILRIEDRNGGILYRSPADATGTEVLDPRIAHQITSILSDVSVRPNAFWQTQLSVPGWQVAAKTGTSAKCLKRDAPPATGDVEGVGQCLERKPSDTWTIGYSPALTTGVWAGNASGGTLFSKADGLTTASRIWHDFMVAAHRRFPTTPRTFTRPAGLEAVQVSLLSGLLPAPCTPPTLRGIDLFFSDRIPKEVDNRCARILVDRVTGLLASEACPASAREERAVYLPQSLLWSRWPTWEEALQKWLEHEQRRWERLEERRRSGEAIPLGSGSLLPLPLAPREECDPALTPGRLTAPTVRIRFPENGGTAPYPSFTPTIDTTVGSSVREVLYVVNGKIVATATEKPFTPPLHLRRVATPGETVEFAVTLIDQYWNEAHHSIHVTLRADRDAPQIELLTPHEGQTLSVGSTLHISVRAEDMGGIDRVRFSLDDTLLTTRRSPPYTLDFPLAGIAPGSHRIEAMAEDAAGNVVRDAVTIQVTDK